MSEQNSNNEQMEASTQTTAATNNKAPAEHIVEYNGQQITISENFWDNDKNQVNIGALAKAQDDLRRKVSEEDRSPKDGLYKVELSEELANLVEVDEKNPLLINAMAVAKACGMPQDKFNELVIPYFEGIVNESKEQEAFIKAEDAKLEQMYGNRKEDMINRIKTYAQNSGLDKDPEAMSELNLWTSSAAGVKLLNMILDERPDAGVSSAGSSAPKYSDDDIFEMMKDPRYQTDKTYQKKIASLWEAVYPSK